MNDLTFHLIGDCYGIPNRIANLLLFLALLAAMVLIGRGAQVSADLGKLKPEKPSPNVPAPPPPDIEGTYWVHGTDSKEGEYLGTCSVIKGSNKDTYDLLYTIGKLQFRAVGLRDGCLLCAGWTVQNGAIRGVTVYSISDDGLEWRGRYTSSQKGTGGTEVLTRIPVPKKV